ncbi:MAG: hypothetical protein GX496_01180 [Firmicutes bacterium]|nr:hypothetical protein [Bacillota bacterium]
MQRWTDHPDDRFLAGVLQRYGDIIVIRCRTRERLMEFTFLADGLVGAGEAMRLRSLLDQALAALAWLTGRPYGSLHLRRAYLAPYTQLTIQRDLDTLSAQEIEVIVGLMRHLLGPRLVAEEAPGDGASGGAWAWQPDQADALAGLLQELKRHRRGRILVGLRQSGQVLVYNELPRAVAPARPRPH